METGTTSVALDDSRRRIVAGVLRSADTEPELREIPNDAQHVRRLFTRLMREGSVKACYEAGVSGYDRYRRLTALGVTCDVIAPALTALSRARGMAAVLPRRRHAVGDDLARRSRRLRPRSPVDRHREPRDSRPAHGAGPVAIAR